MLAKINYNFKTVVFFFVEVPCNVLSLYTSRHLPNMFLCFYVNPAATCHAWPHWVLHSSLVYNWPIEVATSGNCNGSSSKASMWHGNMKVSEVTHENWWGQILILSSGTLLKLIKAHFNVLHFCDDWVCFHLRVKWFLQMICHLYI